MSERDVSPSHEVTRRDSLGTASLTPPPSGEDAPRSVEVQTTITRTKVGRFALGAELGRGGYGIVYRALDPTLDRPVAVKLLRDEVADGPARDRLVREARAVARLGKHPHVVQVHEAGETPEGVVFIAMELVDGESLERIQARRGFGWEEAAAIARKVALGLHHAHRVGLVHRDVKPSNVILDARGEPQITDFGVAKDLESGTASITRSGSAVGTPAFMSPEQAQGLPVDARCDVYGAGALLYALVRGHAPFRAPHVAAVLTAVIEHDPLPLRSGGVSCPADLATVVRKAMAKDPARRYPSANLLAEDIERVLRGERCLARRPNPFAEVAWHFQRKPRNLLLLLGIIGAGAVTYLYRDADEDRKLFAELNNQFIERNNRALLSEELRLRLSQLPAAATTGDKRRICDQAIEDFATAWQPFHERGLIERTAAGEHAARGDVEGAFRRYVDSERYLTLAIALALPPDRTAPLVWRGIVRLEGLDDAAGGRADLERAAVLSPGSGLAQLARQAAARDPAGASPEEGTILEREIVRNKGLGILRLQRSRALAGRDAERAIEEATVATQLAPVMPPAFEGLAAALERAGRKEAAKDALDYARRLRLALAAVRAAEAEREAQLAAGTGPASPW